MPRSKRLWSSLADSTKQRYRRRGITPQAYNAGTVPRDIRKAARGHAHTPERPSQAFRNPDLFGGYLRKRLARGEYVPDNMLPEQLPEFEARSQPDTPRIDNRIGYPERFTFQVITFYRTQGGGVNGNENLMVVETYQPNGDVTTQTFRYNEQEFYTLMNLAKDRGFAVQVTSGQGDVRIAA